jgi:ABC-type Fe3+/spermidine/putrescine transport system ATPase subunit
MSIELRNVSKRYGAVPALRDVNLTIQEGEFVTLLGPSGCGKTTLLRIVAGLIEPSEGEVLIEGAVMNGIAAARRPTGMVFQDYALFPHMTVAANISFGLRMRKMKRAQIARKVAEMAELVGITDLLDRYPSQLSGGQRQRVALARTLAIEPYALLLDEPLAALDRKLRIGMRTELRKLLDKVQMTAIFVTHDQEEALTMSDRIAVMDHGEVVQFGTPMEIYDRPQTAFVASFIGNSNLFTGVVTEAAGGRVLQADGLTLTLPADLDALAGESMIILLRPEHLTLSPLPDTGCTGLGMPGTVAFVTHLGMAIEYEIDLDSGATLRVDAGRSRDQLPLNVGSRVCVESADSQSYLRIAHG